MQINYILPIQIDYILVAFILVLDLILGIVVYRSNPKEKLNKIFFGLVFFTILWSGNNFLENEPGIKIYAPLFLKMDFSAAIFLAYFFLLFCLNFPKATITSSRKKIMIIFPAIVLSILSFSQLIIKNFSFSDSTIQFKRGLLYWPYALTLISYILIGILSLIFKLKRLSRLEKVQTGYVLVGLVLSAIVTISINLILTQFLVISTLLYRIGLYGILFFIIFTSYAILKHRLFNLRVIATELLTFGIWITLFIRTLLSQTVQDLIVNMILLVVMIFFGILLIRSVLKEVRQREQIEKLAYELEQAYGKLKEVDKSKTRFMSITSHQLRTPLTVIKGYVSMILEGTYGKINGKVREKLDRTFQSNERLIKLVRDLLNVSRIEEGRIEMKFAKTNLEALISDLIKELSIKTQEKGLNLKLEKVDEGLPEITIDKDKINEVVFNILDNAIKYTPKGGITVKIKKLISPEGVPPAAGPYGAGIIQIIISDTGEGMTKEELASLFQSFSRGKAGNSLHVEGIGLGLYIAKRFVELHSGKIWAESEGKGKGSAFYIELPIK